MSKRSQLEIGFRRKLLAPLDTLGDDGSLFLANIRPTPKLKPPLIFEEADVQRAKDQTVDEIETCTI